MTATVLEREGTVESIVLDRPVTSKNPEDSSHIVMVPPWEDDQTPQAYTLRARIEGFPIEALCGHIFVPHRDPKPMPVCQRCLEIYEHDPHGKGDRGELPDA